MHKALVDGIPMVAFKGGLGKCEMCLKDARAYCGGVYVNHWKHINLPDCDSWYEPKTEWHINWQNHFDLSWQEVVKTDPLTNAKHRADVFNPHLQLTIEFQHSPISSEIITERESFYGEKMLWVINGAPFKDNFQSYENEFRYDWMFPINRIEEGSREDDWDDEYDSRHTYYVLSKDIKKEVIKEILLRNEFVFDPSANRFVYKLEGHTAIKEMDFQIKIYKEVTAIYHREKVEKRFIKSTYEWQRARRTWRVAQRPVFIDFGDDHVFRIKTNIGKSKGEGVKILKSEFIEKYRNSST